MRGRGLKPAFTLGYCRWVWVAPAGAWIETSLYLLLRPVSMFLHAGRGLKPNSRHISHCRPAGRGLKLRKFYLKGGHNMSPPMRGRGLKPKLYSV